MIEDGLRLWADGKGRRFAVSGIEVLTEVRAMLEKRRDEGSIDPGFFRENLNGFRYLDDGDVEDPEAVLLVSAPRPAHVVSFDLGGGPVDGILPPTYVRYRVFFEDVRAELTEALGDGAAIDILKAPLKSLSVHMGLSAYGRNNVTYVPGFGSYHQLCGYVVGGEAGRRLREAFGRPTLSGEVLLERCETCRACLKACPTGAIQEHRFLISAEKCYTLYSERRGALPDGIRPAGPACLVGCLACQEACPENKGLLRHEALDVAFTAEETTALVELGRREAAGKAVERASGSPGDGSPVSTGVPPDLWPGIVAKFERLNISEDIEAIGRNIEAYRQESKVLRSGGG